MLVLSICFILLANNDSSVFVGLSTDISIDFIFNDDVPWVSATCSPPRLLSVDISMLSADPKR